MRKLFTVLCLLAGYVAWAQERPKNPPPPIQYLGSPQTQVYVRGQLRVDTIFYLPLRDTNYTPQQPGAFIYKTSNKSYYCWNGNYWVNVAVGPYGYGIKTAGNTIAFDSAAVRKVDTLIAVNDSILQYHINGQSYSVKIKGTGGTAMIDSVYNRVPRVTIYTIRGYIPAYNDQHIYLQDQYAAGIFYADTLDNTTADDSAMTFVTVQGQRWKRLVTTPYINARWFGATGSGSVNDQPAIQKAINYVVNNNSSPRDVYLQNGTYVINSPLLMINFNGTAYSQLTVNLLGQANAKNDPSTVVTTIVANYENKFGIGMQQCKGCSIKNITLLGKFTFPNGLNDVQVDTLSYAAWDDGVASQNPFCGYFGIAIDPFSDSNSYTTTANLYPGMHQYYPAGMGRSGSTDITVSNVNISNFIVGFIISPSYQQNGEIINLENANLGGNKVGYAICQPQSKECHVKNFMAWSPVHTLFDNVHWGPTNSGVFPYVDGGNIAGQVKQLAYAICSNFRGDISHVYAEGLFRIGLINSSTGFDIDDCDFNFSSSSNNQPYPDFFIVGQGVVFNGCSLRLYGQTAMRMCLSTSNTLFNNGVMSTPPVITNLDPNYTYSTPTFNNVFMYYGGGIIGGKNTNNSIKNPFNVSLVTWPGNEAIPVYKGSYEYIDNDGLPTVRYKIDYSGVYDRAVNLGSFPVTVNNLNWSAYFVVPGADTNVIRVGDFIAAKDVLAQDQFATITLPTYPVGTVYAISNDTVYLTGVGYGIQSGTSYNLYGIYYVRTNSPIIGNLAAGSNQILSAQSTAPLPSAGSRLDIPQVLPGTFVTKVNVDTIFLSTSNTTGQSFTDYTWTNGYPHIEMYSYSTPDALAFSSTFKPLIGGAYYYKLISPPSGSQNAFTNPSMGGAYTDLYYIANTVYNGDTSKHKLKYFVLNSQNAGNSLPIGNTAQAQNANYAVGGAAIRINSDSVINGIAHLTVNDGNGYRTLMYSSDNTSGNLSSDIGRLPLINTSIYATGLAASNFVTNYNYDNLTYNPYKISTVAYGTGGKFGAWLTPNLTGDSVEITNPFWVVFGDSQAEGLPGRRGRLDPIGGGYIYNYPDSAGQISYSLRQYTNTPCFNQGIGGQTTPQMVPRFPRDVLGKTVPTLTPTSTLPGKPVGVVIMAGINDPGNGIPTAITEQNLTIMASMCAANGIICIMLNIPGDSAASSLKVRQIDSLNAWLASGALNSLNVTVYDYNKFWRNPTYNDDKHPNPAYIQDNIHPTKNGYDSLTKFMAQAVVIPKVTSIVITNELSPAGFAGYSRPTTMTLNGVPYTSTRSTDTLPITAPIILNNYSSDSSWLKVTGTTNVTGTSYTGYSNVKWIMSNAPPSGLYTRITTPASNQGVSNSWLYPQTFGGTTAVIAGNMVAGDVFNPTLIASEPADTLIGIDARGTQYTNPNGYANVKNFALATSADLLVNGATIGLGPGGSIFNTVNGASALHANTSGFDNVAIGASSLLNDTSGHDNTAVGFNVLDHLTNGNFNTAVGSGAFQSATTGTNNTAVGMASGSTATTASFNTYIGYGAGQSATTGNLNVGIGYLALQTVGSSIQNVAVGVDALQVSTGGNNTSMGAFSGQHNSTGAGNSYFGIAAGTNVTTGSNNTMAGIDAGLSTTTGGFNVAIGPYGNLPSPSASGQGNYQNVIYVINGMQATTNSAVPTTTGSVGIGVNAPLARLHLAPGTTTLGPLLFDPTSNALVTTPVQGLMETLNDTLYWTGSSGRHKVYPVAGNSGGIYLPTFTSTANVTTLTADSAVWSQSGTTVSVDGAVTITATSGSSVVSANISLPINSLLANGHAIFGMISGPGPLVGAIKGFGTPNVGFWNVGNPGSTSAITYQYHFAYQIQ